MNHTIRYERMPIAHPEKQRMNGLLSPTFIHVQQLQGLSYINKVLANERAEWPMVSFTAFVGSFSARGRQRSVEQGISHKMARFRATAR